MTPKPPSILRTIQKEMTRFSLWLTALAIFVVLVVAGFVFALRQYSGVVGLPGGSALSALQYLLLHQGTSPETRLIFSIGVGVVGIWCGLMMLIAVALSKELIADEGYDRLRKMGDALYYPMSILVILGTPMLYVHLVKGMGAPGFLLLAPLTLAGAVLAVVGVFVLRFFSDKWAKVAVPLLAITVGIVSLAISAELEMLVLIISALAYAGAMSAIDSWEGLAEMQDELAARGIGVEDESEPEPDNVIRMPVRDAK